MLFDNKVYDISSTTPTPPRQSTILNHDTFCEENSNATYIELYSTRFNQTRYQYNKYGNQGRCFHHRNKLIDKSVLNKLIAKYV